MAAAVAAAVNVVEWRWSIAGVSLSGPEEYFRDVYCWLPAWSLKMLLFTVANMLALLEAWEDVWFVILSLLLEAVNEELFILRPVEDGGGGVSGCLGSGCDERSAKRVENGG